METRRLLFVTERANLGAADIYNSWVHLEPKLDCRIAPWSDLPECEFAQVGREFVYLLHVARGFR